MEAPESSNRATTPPYSLQVRARQGATKGEEVATAVGSCTVAISTCHLPVFSKRLPLSNGQGYAGLAEQQSSAFVGQLVPVIETSQMQSFPTFVQLELQDIASCAGLVLPHDPCDVFTLLHRRRATPVTIYSLHTGHGPSMRHLILLMLETAAVSVDT